MKTFKATFLALLISSSALAQDLRYPTRQPKIPTGGNPQGHAIDSSDDSLSLIQNNQEEHTFTKIVVNVDSKGGANQPPTYKVGYQGVNSSGACDGVYLTGTGGECSGTFTPPNNSTWNDTAQEITMTASSCTLPVGQVCQLITYSSGTIGGSNFNYFRRSISNGFLYDKMEYHLRVSNGGAATRGAEIPPGGTTDGAGRYWGNLTPSYSYDSFSSDSNPNEIGNTITEQCANTYRYAGCQICMTQMPGAGKTVQCNLYNGTTLLDSCTIDSDALGDGFGGDLSCFFDQAGRATLTCGQPYNVMIKPQETSSGLRLAKLLWTNNNQMDQAWNTKSMYKVTRNGGAISTVNTERVCVIGILDRFDAPAASGGRTQQTDILGGGL